jgi:transposase InsO family protein
MRFKWMAMADSTVVIIDVKDPLHHRICIPAENLLDPSIVTWYHQTLSHLSLYPRPARIVLDHGTEFTGWAFQNLINQHGIHALPSSVKNPQSNAIFEHMHQSITNSLDALLHTDPPQM